MSDAFVNVMKNYMMEQYVIKFKLWISWFLWLFDKGVLISDD